MAVSENLPSLSFTGLEIKPGDTAKFVTNFNEQQNRLMTFVTELNSFAGSIDQAVNSAQSAASNAANDVRSELQGLKDSAATSQSQAAGSASTALQWATSLTVVSGGFKGARGYAEDAANSAIQAQSAAAALLIDDDIESDQFTWSSAKLTAWQQALAQSNANQIAQAVSISKTFYLATS